MTTPYHYLMAAGDAAADALIDDLSSWHDRMVAHMRRHGAPSRTCRCGDPDTCPRQDARDLWLRAGRTFGDAAARLTFLRQHAVEQAHG